MQSVKIKSSIEYSIGTIIMAEDTKKVYEVIKCQRLLGHKGYGLTLNEIKPTTTIGE